MAVRSDSGCGHGLRARSFQFVRCLIPGRPRVLGATALAWMGASPPGRSTLAAAGRRLAPVLGRPRHQPVDEHGTKHECDDCDGVVHHTKVACSDRSALNARSRGANATA